MAKNTAIEFAPSDLLSLGADDEEQTEVAHEATAKTTARTTAVITTPRGQQLDLLREPLPPGAIRTRLKNPTKPESPKNPRLSYLSKPFVINNLNRIFGLGHWSTAVKQTTYLPGTEGEPPQAVSMTVTLTVMFADGAYASFDGEGTSNNGRNSWDLDMVVGSAWAMAFKRAASCLGEQFGLNLYEKEDDESDDAGTSDAGTGETTGEVGTETGKKPTPLRTAQHRAARDRYDCVSCGAEVTSYTDRSNKFYSADDQSRMRKGDYCYPCFQARRG